MRKTANLRKPKFILWMGSSIGNLDRTEAADFLRGFLAVLQGQDSMLIGMDACQESDKVYHAYNDKRGTTHKFILNGLMHANKLMGKEVFRKEDWKVVGEYDEVAGRHQAFYSPVRDVMVEGTLIRAGEKIRVEESYKYSLLQSNELWQRAGLMVQARFDNRINQYRKLVFHYTRSFFPFFASCLAQHQVYLTAIYNWLPSIPRFGTANKRLYHYIIHSCHATFPTTLPSKLRSIKYHILVSIPLTKHVGRSAFGHKTGLFLSSQSERICCPARTLPTRVRTTMDGMGHCYEAHDTRGRATIQTHQASKLLPLLPRPHSHLLGHTFDKSDRRCGHQAELLPSHL